MLSYAGDKVTFLLRRVDPLSRCLFPLRFYHHDSRPTPLRLPSDHNSLLPLVHSSSNLRLSPFSHNPTTRHCISTRKESDVYLHEEFVVPFYVSTPVSAGCRPIGWLRPLVAQALKADHDSKLMCNQRSPWQLQHTRESSGLPLSAAFAPWINVEGRQQRTLYMERLVTRWKQENLFADILSGQSLSQKRILNKSHDR